MYTIYVIKMFYIHNYCVSLYYQIKLIQRNED